MWVRMLTCTECPFPAHDNYPHYILKTMTNPELDNPDNLVGLISQRARLGTHYLSPHLVSYQLCTWEDSFEDLLRSPGTFLMILIGVPV